MSQFLLVHGAFHGAWCWRKTVAELERRGHRAKAIDLPGQGEDRTPLKEVTLDTMVDRIIAEMADLPGKVVLVGHSLGGIPISVTGEKSPDRIKALVYLSAFLPRDGEALIDIEIRSQSCRSA
jgi:pimeloyl-ACP methyl ester carboxylesterase